MAGESLVELSKAFKFPSAAGMSKPRDLKTHTMDGKKRFSRKSRAAAAAKAPGLAAMSPNTAANPFSRMNMDMNANMVPNPFSGNKPKMVY